MSRAEAVELLGELLGQDVTEVDRTVLEIPGVGYFAAQGTRGGKRYLVGMDGGYLFGVSALSIEEMVAAYQSGQRSS